ncbi:condensin complex protein MksE [Parachryseolinea silvisoli]|jgi:hypothetical protein|uniref:condensin complex protein MksE n=1 Tax=Parachryseolinea silvisoli TaxID=2873601 RepID=UPI002265C965|nr:hypothetical protein [Parachryseolinea silvisoli]MCD9018220.1 hypothetical protein [Parachryseolinea silvisoli]
MNIPKQTPEIFSILSKGNFISSNGSRGKLFDVINFEDNFQTLKEFFAHTGYHLEKGHNYYYFSQQEETNTIMEKKLEQFAYYIDVMDFFSSMDAKPVVGTRYRVTQIAEECYANERLKQKLYALSRREKMVDKVAEIANDLTAGGFFEQEDEDTYKVMDAIHYLEQVITLITIEEEDGEQADS